jgi:hypothetical protein
MKIHRDCWILVLDYLSLEDLRICAAICKEFKKISRDERVWMQRIKSDLQRRLKYCDIHLEGKLRTFDMLKNIFRRGNSILLVAVQADLSTCEQSSEASVSSI